LKIVIEKQKELVSITGTQYINTVSKNDVTVLMNELELFANIDSSKITEDYIKKNNLIFEKLIELGVQDLYYNIGMMAGKDHLHSFIKDYVIYDPIVRW